MGLCSHPFTDLSDKKVVGERVPRYGIACNVATEQAVKEVEGDARTLLTAVWSKLCTRIHLEHAAVLSPYLGCW